ncbi:hypothetical protein A2U01_0007603, partial [Trifolium medium]|nr:hypothetical protein [Trifolium medium]
VVPDVSLKIEAALRRMRRFTVGKPRKKTKMKGRVHL